jgi:hypothetical protein
MGACIAAADRPIMEQQTKRNSIKALVAISHEEKENHGRNGSEEDEVRGRSSRTNRTVQES